jgi:hypothetical protein
VERHKPFNSLHLVESFQYAIQLLEGGVVNFQRAAPTLLMPDSHLGPKPITEILL